MHKDLLSTPLLSQIQEVVSSFFNISSSKILKSTPGTLNLPRAILIYLSAILTHEKNENIGIKFGNISSSAVSKAYHKIQTELTSNLKLADTIFYLEQVIRSQFKI